MSERLGKINFALNSIPLFNGDPNKLSTFINAVNMVQQLFGTFNPPLDEFDKTISFLNIKSKIIDKALDNIKDLEFASWNELREHLILNFKDKLNSITILNEILKNNEKNPHKLLDIIKSKFTTFKSRVSVEHSNIETRITIINYAEKLIVNNFISTVTDPYRNNLATRNPTSISEIETLLNNDFQYLRSQNTNFNQNKNSFPRQNLNQATNAFPNKPFNVKEQPLNPYKTFAPRTQLKNAQNIRPTPMSTQTRQSTPNYYRKFSNKELHNTEMNDNETYNETDETSDDNNQIHENFENTNENPNFLDENPDVEPPDIEERF